MSAELVPLPRPDQDERQAFVDYVISNINAEMGRQKMPRVEMARRLGVAPSTITKRLDGQQPITLDFIEGICSVLRISPLRLVSGTYHFEPDPDGGPGIAAPPTGLEPVTYRLTVGRSAN